MFDLLAWFGAAALAVFVGDWRLAGTIEGEPTLLMDLRGADLSRTLVIGLAVSRYEMLHTVTLRGVINKERLIPTALDPDSWGDSQVALDVSLFAPGLIGGRRHGLGCSHAG